MRLRKLTIEHTLYFLIFLLALGIRLYRLGAAPLSDFEADWAQQALDLAGGGQPVLGPQPAYILLTSLFFILFEATNFLARLVPALAGSLLVLLPLLGQGMFGKADWTRKAGLITALGLAIDPGLVALSRMAGSSMAALAFGLLALTLYYRRSSGWAGLCAGLALLSGPGLLHGALVLGLSWALLRWLEISLQLPRIETGTEELSALSSPASRRTGLFVLAGTVLVAGLLFLRVPQGLGALAAGIPAYLRSWVTLSDVPALRLPGALLVYQPFVLLFSLIGAVRGWKGTVKGWQEYRGVARLSIWAFTALLLAVVYPGRQVGDLIWALVPLWGLAAFELTHHLPDTAEDKITRLVAGGLGLLVFVLLVVAWFNLLAMVRVSGGAALYWAVIGGALVLGFVSLMLVSAGWSSVAARLGLVWGLALALGLGLLAGTWGLAQLRPNGAQELWSRTPSAGQVELLTSSLDKLSIWGTGHRQQLEIVMTIDSPSLRWALRNFPDARYVTTLAASEAPAVVITPKEIEYPNLAEMYRGQDLVWRVYPGWIGAFPPDFINWLAFRQAPLAQEQVILWARVDLFADEGLVQPGDQP